MLLFWLSLFSVNTVEVTFVRGVVVGVVGSAQKGLSGMKIYGDINVMKNSTCVCKFQFMGIVPPCNVVSKRFDFDLKGFGAGREVCPDGDQSPRNKWWQIG